MHARAQEEPRGLLVLLCTGDLQGREAVARCELGVGARLEK